MLLASTGLLFAFLVAFSMPIVFALGAAAILGLVLGGYSLEMLASSLIGASQNWILLAIPSFIFAGIGAQSCLALCGAGGRRRVDRGLRSRDGLRAATPTR